MAAERVDVSNAHIGANFHPAQQFLVGDAENLSEIARSNLVHILAALTRDNQSDVRPGVVFGCTSNMADSTTLRVQPGLVMSARNVPNDTAFQYNPVRLVTVPSAILSPIPSDPGTYPRLDLFVLRPAVVNDTDETRLVVDTTGPTFTDTTLSMRKLYTHSGSHWFTGTAGSMAMPSGLPADAVPVAALIRSAPGVVTLVDMRRLLGIAPEARVLAMAGVEQEGWVSPAPGGAAATAHAGLFVNVAGGRVSVRGTVYPVLPSRVEAGADPGGRVWTRVLADTVHDLGFVVPRVVSGAPGGPYTPAASTALATLYVAAGGTAVGDIIDERQVGRPLRGDAFQRGAPVPPRDVKQAVFALAPSPSVALSSDAKGGYYVEGELLWADGTPYVPDTDGPVNVRVEVYGITPPVTIDDGYTNFTSSRWADPFVRNFHIQIYDSGGPTDVGYSSPVAVRAMTGADSFLGIYLRRDVSLPMTAALYPQIAVVVTVERWAQDRPDLSGLTSAQRDARLLSGRLPAAVNAVVSSTQFIFTNTNV